MLVVDAFAWFEYFFGTGRGEKVWEFVESEEMLVTPAIALFEIKNKLVREGRDYKKQVQFVMERSLVEPLTAEIALKAVDVKKEKRLKTSDAFIYATALAKKCRLLTGDQHFKNVEGVEFI